MDESSIKMFSTDKDSVVLPCIDNDELAKNQSLISESIDNAILGDKVKTLIIPEDTEISKNNYIFDFSELSVITAMQKASLKSLVAKNGDTQLYLYNKKNGLTSFGFGNKYTLERVAPIIKKHVFNNEIKIYKDFVVGGALNEVKSSDITKLRLNL